MKPWLVAAVSGAAVCLAAGRVHAAVVVVTVDGVGSGSLGATEFSEAAFRTRLSYGDDEVVAGVGPTWVTPVLSGAAIEIEGLGVLGFTNPQQVFYNTGTGAAGINDLVAADLIALSGPGLEGWELKTAVGPVRDPDPFFAQFVDIPTSGGPLTFTAMSAAERNAVVIPEPGSGLLGLTGMALAAVRRRRRAQSRYE